MRDDCALLHGETAVPVHVAPVNAQRYLSTEGW